MVPKVNAGVDISSEPSLADSDYLRGVIFVGKGHAVKATNHLSNHDHPYESYDDVTSRTLFSEFPDNPHHTSGRRFGTTRSEPIAKPILSPINALHLRIGEPEHTPESPTASTLETPTASLLHSPAPSPSSNTSSSYFNTIPPSPRVRFRSRVRITSGLHRHHRKRYSQDTPSSSLSGSPSSSISAPLRTQSDDNSPSWGPLGQRVSFLAWSKTKDIAPHGHRPKKERRRRRKGFLGVPNERTPLLGSRTHSAYDNGEGVRERYIFGEDRHEEVAKRLAREVDAVFGTWPQRLLNPYWWWWQLEPVICCQHCADDVDP